MKKFFLCLIAFIVFGCTSFKNIPSDVEVKVKNLSLPVIITGIMTGSPNSAGGVSLNILFKNISDKDIKYITFYVTPYNEVNDVVECTIRNYSTHGCKITGPIKAGSYYGREESTWEKWAGDYGAWWENIWYNSTITYAKISSIEIIYMDGARKAYNTNQVQKMIYIVK